MLKKAGVLLVVLIPLVSAAQFYKVYPYMTPEAGEKELVYWFSAIGSDHQYSFFGDWIDRQGLMAHSLELEYGLSNKWTAGIYLDFEQPKGQDLKHIRTKALMFHGRFWKKVNARLIWGFTWSISFPEKITKMQNRLKSN